MITGELKNKIDRIWDAFWSGGISNPLEVIEQITYLLFIRGLDDLQTAKENKARRTGKPIENPIFQPDQYDLRWSRFKDLGPGVMHKTVDEQVFPLLRQLGGDGSTYSEHMKDARFTIPTPALLSRVVDMLDDIPMQDRDTNGDLYEYALSKLSTSGTNGQFRTPRHIIKLMVEMTAPTPTDEICDPASGTCGFLVAAAEYLRQKHPEIQTDAEQWKHFNHSMFHGYDFDFTMLRIGSMNMLLHGVEQPDIRYRDSLSEGAAGEEGLYSLILANPPFAGSLDYESTSQGDGRKLPRRLRSHREGVDSPAAAAAGRLDEVRQGEMSRSRTLLRKSLTTTSSTSRRTRTATAATPRPACRCPGPSRASRAGSAELDDCAGDRPSAAAAVYGIQPCS